MELDALLGVSYSDTTSQPRSNYVNRYLDCKGSGSKCAFIVYIDNDYA